MSNPTYRERAAKCLRVAGRVKQPLNKAVLVRMASAWHELARQRERAVDDTGQALAEQTARSEGRAKNQRSDLGREAE